MENYLEKAIPILDKTREIIYSLADFIARAFEFPPENVYILIIILSSLYLSKWVLGFFYTTLDGRRLYHIILAAIIFSIIKYLGA